MPLAYSTLGCPGDSLDQVIATAKTAGATGLELRLAAGEFVSAGMGPAQSAAVAERLAVAGLTVLAVAAYVRVCAPAVNPGSAAVPNDGTDAAGGRGAGDPVLAELVSAIELTARLSAGNVGAAAQLRVFPGAGLEPCGSGQEVSADMAAADLRGAHRLNMVADLARERGVTILLETHDSHPRAADVRRILEHVDAAAPVQVIWDLMHPWRYGEEPERTAKLLARSLAYPQFKDGVKNPRDHSVTLTLPGQGELPLARMLELTSRIAATKGIGDPWVSLEWERAWHPELPPVAEALDAFKAVLALPRAVSMAGDTNDQ
ncbi:sugar phosphate isomerase/epimerase family protein [Specibacter sp. NPDC057265]|uniref:sugar phosphate isomerase/epimerase family protein n=1 Tax=Specibacter sp. NPDC057265 TaxID=3346075 RepID=UPI0036260CFD